MGQVTTTETGKSVKDMPLNEGEIRPNDMTTVYSASMEKDPFHPVGHPMEVHVALAEKLVAAGKATKEAPKTKEK